ncbi:hypothetical protein G9A89_009929 [Geosiphon pyriformis]|nr:hypothetical protein G9A89_009929 [Geosiphon pyriformis]
MSSKRKTIEWEATTSAVVGTDLTIENKRKKIDENQNFIITDVNTYLDFHVGESVQEDMDKEEFKTSDQDIASNTPNKKS